MKRKKTTIQDLIFFIRNGVIDCKDYFIPLNAISYVRLVTKRENTILTIEINTGHTFLLRHSNIEFLSDLMNIIKANRFNTSAYYQVDILKGTIYCTTPGNPDDSSATSMQKNHSLPKKNIPSSSNATPIHPTAAAAFRSRAKRSFLSAPPKAPVSDTSQTKEPVKSSLPPVLPKAGSGLGISDSSSIGCGFTAAELYAHKKKSAVTVTPSSDSLHSLLPETQPKKEKKEPFVPQHPNVKMPKSKKSLPKYYSASEYLRNHGDLSTSSDGPVAPYQEILANQRQNFLLDELNPVHSSKVPSGLSQTAITGFTNKDWTDVEYYFFQKKTNFSKDDFQYQVLEKAEDFAYHKDKAGITEFFHSLPEDIFQSLFSDAECGKLPLLKKILTK